MSAPKWQRHRFHADGNDPRPVKFPPPGPWWCSGYAFDESYSVVVAYLPYGTDVTQWWPEATAIETSDADSPKYSERFPRPDWWHEE